LSLKNSLPQTNITKRIDSKQINKCSKEATPDRNIINKTYAIGKIIKKNGIAKAVEVITYQ